VEDPVRWAQCLRQHGLQVDDPDPDPNSARTKPHIHTDGVPQSRIDAATAACRQFNPNFGRPPAADPAEEQRMYEFVKCMREHGIDIPFGADGRPTPSGLPTAPVDTGPTVSGDVFDRVYRECAQRVPGAVSTDFPDTKK